MRLSEFLLVVYFYAYGLVEDVFAGGFADRDDGRVCETSFRRDGIKTFDDGVDSADDDCLVLFADVAGECGWRHK